MGIALLSLLTMAPLAWSGEETGTIAGTTRYVGDVPAAQKIVASDGTVIIHNDIVVDEKSKGLRHVAAILQGKFTPAKKRGPASIDQRDMLFVPRVIAVQEGDLVRFENSDLCNHCVKADGTRDENLFNIITPPGKSYEFRFKAQKSPVVIGCPIHGWMRAWVYVAPHPYLAVSDAQGRFRIENVPVGKHTLLLAHADTGFREEIAVEVEAGKTTELRREWKTLKK
jgi:plastocyanin